MRNNNSRYEILEAPDALAIHCLTEPSDGLRGRTGWVICMFEQKRTTFVHGIWHKETWGHSYASKCHEKL